MTYVLVHGGGLDHRCWDPLVGLLSGPVHAIDLPGRGSHPADLATVAVSDFVAAVVDLLVVEDLHDVKLVGHSLAGITLPGVARAQPERLAHLGFVSSAVPPPGATVADVLSSSSVPVLAELMTRLGDDLVTSDGRLHPDFARAMFANDLDEAQTTFLLSILVPEAIGVITELVDVSLPEQVARTYVRLGRDESVVPSLQESMIANLGGAEVVDLDAGHMAMISQPEALAAILEAW